jgi:hypothetical protein
MWWHQYEDLYPERRLVGPNISHLGLTWLLDWRTAFLRLYGHPPRIWALGVHCYMVPGSCQSWVETNIALAKQWTQSGKVWVTEWAMTSCYYAVTAGVATQTWALRDADVFMSWLLANPNVERETWFIARWYNRSCVTDLISSTGTLTDFGVWHQRLARPDR